MTQSDSKSTDQPSLANTHLRVGKILHQMGDVDGAVTEYEKSLGYNPNCAEVRYILGSALVELGRFDDASHQLEETLRLNPKYARVYHILSDLARQDRYRFSTDQIDRIRQLSEDTSIPLEDECLVNFALGDILDKFGDHDEAFRCYQRANDSQRRLCEDSGAVFNPVELRHTVDATISVFDRDYFSDMRGGGLDSEIPIFVIGMPRSGTTLIEKIIANHAEASGAGELLDIAQLAINLPQSVNSSIDYPQCLRHLVPSTIDQIGQRYLQSLIERCGNSRRIVDKTPANFLFLGFIWTLFPNARVVHCQRNVMDVCLSCFFSSFQSVTWSMSLDDIGVFYQEYSRLMDHWGEVLPLRRMDVSYERLVTDPLPTMKQLIEFCGLDWNDECQKMEFGSQAVRTTSRVQVRQPIYKTSVDRWRQYESQLLPLQKYCN